MWQTEHGFIVRAPKPLEGTLDCLTTWHDGDTSWRHKGRFTASMDNDPQFYECGCCGQLHWYQFGSDCRNDHNRFNIEDIEARYGYDGYTELDPEDESID
jgi:hypothetical protein